VSESQFDYNALYLALDRQRQRRGLTWADAAREIRVAASTIARLETAPQMAEADGEPTA
jgi:transcriptional regulator with XRE-family HTH domain